MTLLTLFLPAVQSSTAMRWTTMPVVEWPMIGRAEPILKNGMTLEQVLDTLPIFPHSRKP